jgi:hypothetical protein
LLYVLRRIDDCAASANILHLGELHIWRQRQLEKYRRQSFYPLRDEGGVVYFFCVTAKPETKGVQRTTVRGSPIIYDSERIVELFIVGHCGGKYFPGRINLPARILWTHPIHIVR